MSANNCQVPALVVLFPYMKVLLFGKNSKNIEGLVKDSGFEIVRSNPDVIVSFGGDGTLLSSERQYPGIPKLPIRNSQFCNKCANHQDRRILEDLSNEKLKLKEYKKLHTTFDGKSIYALNDFVIRNEQAIHAIRFQVNGKFFIGDGIIISTPFGSSGYFKSITGESFDEGLPAGRQGFGLAFNNTTEKENPVYLNEDDSINFQLVRGKANLSFDNNPDIFNISEGTQVTFDLSDKVARIYTSSLRCSNCQIIRG